jgi:DNA invertase Pin-like site-specific DNA recombinase
MRVAIYARVSRREQQTLPLQLKAMRQYASIRKWKVKLQVEDVRSGVKERKKREEIMDAARRREIDAVIVWKLDRWGRSLHDLFESMKELKDLGVCFVSVTELIDLTTPAGEALAGMLSVFAKFERDLLRERVKAGIAHARSKGQRHGRPATARKYKSKVKALFENGLNKSEIARRFSISRTSVRRLLES